MLTLQSATSLTGDPSRCRSRGESCCIVKGICWCQRLRLYTATTRWAIIRAWVGTSCGANRLTSSASTMRVVSSRGYHTMTSWTFITVIAFASLSPDFGGRVCLYRFLHRRHLMATVTTNQSSWNCAFLRRAQWLNRRSGLLC